MGTDSRLNRCPQCDIHYYDTEPIRPYRSKDRTEHRERIVNIAGFALCFEVWFDKAPNIGRLTYERISKIATRTRYSYMCRNCGFEWDKYPPAEFIRGD